MLKIKQNEQAQLLEVRSYAFIVDGIGCNGVKQISNIEKCGQTNCSHFFIADALV